MPSNFEAFEGLDNCTRFERTGACHSICIEPMVLERIGVSRRRRWEAVLWCRTTNETPLGPSSVSDQCQFVEPKMPSRCNHPSPIKARVEWNNDFEVLAVNHTVTQADLNRVGQRVHHVSAVVVQNAARLHPSSRTGATNRNEKSSGRERRLTASTVFQPMASVTKRTAFLWCKPQL